MQQRPMDRKSDSQGRRPDGETRQIDFRGKDLDFIRSAVDLFPEPAYWVRNDGGFIFVNKAACSIHGFSREEFLEMAIYDIDPDYSPALWQMHQEKVLLQGKIVFNTLFVTSGGAELPVKLTVNHQELGNEECYCVFAQDISARKQTEEALRESETKYRDMVETVSDVIWEVDTKGFYTYVSPNSCDVSGYTPEERMGQPFYAFVPPEKIKQFQKYFTANKVSPTPIENLEITLVKKNGSFVFMESNIKPFFDAKGVLVGYRGVDRDVTEKRILQAEADRASHLAALGELAAGVAHEINNPINGVINYAEILKDEFEEREEDADIPNRIIKESVRISQIVGNLLEFSRDKKEKIGPVSIEAIVSDTLSLVNRQISNDGIKLSVGGLSDLPQIKACYREIQQVVLNMISNARYALNEKYPKYHDNKTIQISGEKIERDDKDYIRLIFHDCGNGIPEEILDKICNPFFSTKPKNKGTGLGLSISLGIVKSHGGMLWFKSKEGQYSKVIVDLPVWEES